MLSDLKLPPGFTVTITLDPDKYPLSALVTVRRHGEWVGDVSTAPHRLERAGELQDVVDMMTKRGVHLLTTGEATWPKIR